jgi:RHS repeat-associated protein
MPTLLLPKPKAQEPVSKTVAKLWKKLGVAFKEITKPNNLKTKSTFDTQAHPELNEHIDKARMGEGHLKTDWSDPEPPPPAQNPYNPHPWLRVYGLPKRLSRNQDFTKLAPQAMLRNFEYDKAGQVTAIQDNRRGRTEYDYDPVGRLINAGGVGDGRFAFDPAGNILSKPIPDPTKIIQPPLPKVLTNLIKEYAGTHYEYDDRGNVIYRIDNGKKHRFEWDAFNRLTRVRSAKPNRGDIGTDIQYTYDPLGRRITKVYSRETYPALFENNPAFDFNKPVGPGNHCGGDKVLHHGQRTSTHTTFGWDGDTLATESQYSVTAEITEHGEVVQYLTKPNQEPRTTHYLFEPGTFVPLAQATKPGLMQLKQTTNIKELTAQNGGDYDSDLDPIWTDPPPDPTPFTYEQMHYYNCDHLGTPTEMTDCDGVMSWAAKHKAWGEATVAISDAAKKAGVKNPFRFQGQYFDEETGLHYNRYRYYDPHSGRFVSKDPIGLFGGANLHSYAPNPIEWVDPLGLAKKSGSENKQTHHSIV